MSSVIGKPRRILVVRPDTYGDLILTIPLLRALLERLPDAETYLLIRSAFGDIAPLLPAGVQVILTGVNPYAGVLPADEQILLELGKKLRAISPDWVIAPCFNGTWLERWVASQLPAARRIGVAGKPLDPLTLLSAESLGHTMRKDADLFPEQVPVDQNSMETAKNDAVLAHLFGGDAAGGVSHLTIPDGQRQITADFLTKQGLTTGAFLACCPAGVANVSIKSWPPGRFAICLAQAERKFGLPALVLGHEREGDLVHEVISEAEKLEAKPRSWLGCDGSFVQFAALIASARVYLGNDTAAMHIAAATGVPTVGIFGGGTWPRFAPVGPAPTRAVVQPVGCFGCDWRCYFGDAPCLQTIPEAAVLDTLSEVLSSTEPEMKLRIVSASEGLNEQARELMAHVASARERAVTADSAMELARRLLASEKDRHERLAVIEEQGAQLGKVQAELNLQNAAFDDLRGHFAASEADRAARLVVIGQQQATVSQLQEAVEQLQVQIGQQQIQIEQRQIRLDQLERERVDVFQNLVRLKINLRSMVKRWLA